MDEQEKLALLRTLLAYERNILSIERTQLAQFRTGITLALITPSAIATFTYAFEFLPKEYAASTILYILLTVVTLYGLTMTVDAYFGLRKTKQKKKEIREKKKALRQGIDSSLTSLLVD